MREDRHTWVMVPLPFTETLAEALAAWREHGLASGHSERTITSRTYTIHRLAASGMDPLAADRAQLTTWLSELDIKRSSKATYRAQLLAFYAWLTDTERRQDDPSVKLPRPRTSPGQPRPLSAVQVDAVIAACADPRARVTRAYVVLACYAGLRVHEIAKVRGEDVQGDELVVVGKGGREHSLPMHSMVATLAAGMPRIGWWFPTDSGSGHVHRCSVSSAIKRAMVRAGVPGTPHATRHFYGTQALRASGGDLRTAQRALRHANVATTAIYTEVSDDSLRRAIAGIPAA